MIAAVFCLLLFLKKNSQKTGRNFDSHIDDRTVSKKVNCIDPVDVVSGQGAGFGKLSSAFFRFLSWFDKK
jgi:hypothetical protein